MLATEAMLQFSFSKILAYTISPPPALSSGFCPFFREFHEIWQKGTGLSLIFVLVSNYG